MLGGNTAMYINDEILLDVNLYEVIIYCVLQKKSASSTEIVVTYENGAKERIWTYNHNRYSFDHHDFIGMTKLEAVFYCDRRKSRTLY